MNIAAVIKQGLGVVGAIFAAFSGFLFSIAPPSETSAAFPVGIASLILLVIFLTIRVLFQYRMAKKRRIKIWIIVAAISFVIFLVTVPLYYKTFTTLVFRYDDGKLYVKGNELTEGAGLLRDELKAVNENSDDAVLVSRFGLPSEPGVKEQVWTSVSIEKSKAKLIITYIVLVVSVGCTILSLAALE
jgi:hypothetical protein